MAILTIAVSVSAPTLTRFFRGRILNSEARRMLALTRNGQSRAVSEGLPMDLWVNAEAGRFGLEAEPSYDNADPKKVEYTLDTGLQLKVEKQAAPLAANTLYSSSHTPSIASVPRIMLAQPHLPTIRFLPDGSLGPDSPQSLCLIARDGSALWLKQSRNRLSYEIKSDPED